MDYFGINSPEDLPKIKEVLAEQVVQPTVIKDASPIEEEPGKENREDEVLLSVTEDGELVDKADPNSSEEGIY
jgi:segregation and condensation protein B